MADDLATAAVELAALPRADRVAILDALASDERRRVEAAMRGEPVEIGESSAHSPWFDGLASADHISAATRAALTAARSPIVADRPADPARPGRTLMQAASGLLTQARLRR